MSVAWAVLATACALLLALSRARAGDERERVARACHEVRGPLHAAGLALHGASTRAPSPALLGAVERELGRAALALADLDAARAPLRERLRSTDVRNSRSAGVSDDRADLGAIVCAHAPAWRALTGADGRALRLRLPPRPAVVRGDALRLAQAIANLVANAVEHGAGDVELRVRHLASGAVAVEVRDAGGGLPAPVAELIARPRRGYGARGRGLAIAEQIAARHGGRLATAPAPAPGGACVVLELPAAAVAPVRRVAPPEDTAS